MTAWLRGSDSIEAEASAELVAELALRGLLYLRALQSEKPEKGRKR